jgi:hypothetical protein
MELAQTLHCCFKMVIAKLLITLQIAADVAYSGFAGNVRYAGPESMVAVIEPEGLPFSLWIEPVLVNYGLFLIMKPCYSKLSI